jgi:DNA end-binding protein Ku
MPRPLWKGAISFGLVHVPVSLYPASRSEGLTFDMLDKRDFGPIGYRRVNKKTGEEVPRENIVKGYEYAKGEYVLVTDEDFREANVKATQTVEIMGFVDAKAVPPYYFDTPYYLEPGRRGEKGYTLLREVLLRTGRIAVAQVVIRSRQRLAAVIALERVLVLNTLRYESEIRAASELALPAAGTGDVSDRELAMAERLVDDMTEAWRPGQYSDTYRNDLMARIEARIARGDIHALASPRSGEAGEGGGAEVIDLMSLLRRSLEKTGGPAEPQEEASGQALRAKRAAARRPPSRAAAGKPTRRRA